MPGVPTFTISAEGGLIKSTNLGRQTMLALNATLGDLKEETRHTIVLDNGDVENVSFSTVTTARVVIIKPFAESDLGNSGAGVLVKFNGDANGVELLEQMWVTLFNCVVTSIEITNSSGNQVALDVILAGDGT